MDLKQTSFNWKRIPISKIKNIAALIAGFFNTWLTADLKLKLINPSFMNKFSSQEIESQYNLIIKLLSEREKYKDAIDAIKKDIAYMPLELKKRLEEENISL